MPTTATPVVRCAEVVEGRAGEDRPAGPRPGHRALPRHERLRTAKGNGYNVYNVLVIQITASVVLPGAGRSSEVERSLMVRWVVGSILHGVDPLSYFSFRNKGRGMCYPVCRMVHIKEPLLLIGKSSLCGGSGFPFSLSEWSLTICLTPYNRR